MGRGDESDFETRRAPCQAVPSQKSLMEIAPPTTLSSFLIFQALAVNQREAWMCLQDVSCVLSTVTLRGLLTPHGDRCES